MTVKHRSADHGKWRGGRTPRDRPLFGDQDGSIAGTPVRVTVRPKSDTATIRSCGFFPDSHLVQLGFTIRLIGAPPRSGPEQSPLRPQPRPSSIQSWPRPFQSIVVLSSCFSLAVCAGKHAPSLRSRRAAFVLDPHPRREPGGDNPHPLPERSPRNPLSPLTHHRRKKIPEPAGVGAGESRRVVHFARNGLRGSIAESVSPSR